MPVNPYCVKGTGIIVSENPEGSERIANQLILNYLKYIINIILIQFQNIHFINNNLMYHILLK